MSDCEKRVLPNKCGLYLHMVLKTSTAEFLYHSSRGQQMIVSDVMTPYFASAHISSTVGDVMEKMLEEGLSTMLIVDDRSELVGSIEESLLMIAAFDEQWRNNPVSLHMDRKFVTIRPDEPVGQVVEKFMLHRCNEFPVLDHGKLIGVLTRRQLLRSVLGNQERAAKNAFNGVA